MDGSEPEVQNLRNKAQIIKDFNSFDFKCLNTNKKIYLLKVLYSYYEAIIKAYYGSGLYFPSSGIDDLNDYFKILRRKIIEAIESDNLFSEMRKSDAYGLIFETITSLYTSADFINVVWDDSLLPAIINLREEIADKDLFENGSEVHPSNTGVALFLDTVSKEIETLTGQQERRTNNFYKDELPKYKEQFENAFTSSTKEKDTIKHEHTHRFENNIQEKEISINHKITEDNVIIKNNKKRVTLPSLGRTDWSKVTIKFISDRDILLCNEKQTKQSSFESLGCDDGRTGKPDESWNFLLNLALSGGITQELNKDEREKQKKRKQRITDILRKIFDNDTDPFEKEQRGVYKAKFVISYLNKDEDKTPKGKFDDLNDIRSEMTESSQENTENDFSQ